MGPPRSLSTWLKRLMVSSTWVGQSETLRFAGLVLFNLGLARRAMAILLLVHLVVIESMKSCRLLQAAWQCSLPNLPTSSQLSSNLMKGEVKERLRLKAFTNLG